MDRKLIKLVEFNCQDIAGRPDQRCYEIYEGDFIQIYGDSANGYWHDRRELRPFETVGREAKYLVVSEGVYVGHWSTLPEIDEFITYYMRGTDLVVVDTAELENA